MRTSDTIVALSTPPGRSGIGVIRLSGPEALDYIRVLLRKPDFSPESQRATLKTLHDPERGEAIDQSLVTYFKSPNSFTGEDVVELSCHGSPVLLLNVVDVLLSLGARTADAGEFTLRALSNGRLNLTEAEAIRDLIDAQTHAAVRQAARQLGGELSAQIQPIKNLLLEIIVPLESALEFVEDDLPDVALIKLKLQLEDLIQKLESIAHSFSAGRLLKEGLKVTLVGRPNVGKSSVFNSLLARDRAIVTAVPGTTRDSLTEVLNIEGVPVLLTDTAGIRTAEDPIERIGIERTRQAIADSDLVVAVIDGSLPLNEQDDSLISELSEGNYVIALNKSDLEHFHHMKLYGEGRRTEPVRMSAKTGDGLDILRRAILAPFERVQHSDSSFLITNARHFDLLRRAANSLRNSQNVIDEGATEDLILVGLYNSLRFLDEITGETTPEDVLSQIFATFCIGK